MQLGQTVNINVIMIPDGIKLCITFRLCSPLLTRSSLMASHFQKRFFLTRGPGNSFDYQGFSTCCPIQQAQIAACVGREHFEPVRPNGLKREWPDNLQGRRYGSRRISERCRPGAL